MIDWEERTQDEGAVTHLIRGIMIIGLFRTRSRVGFDLDFPEPSQV